MSLLGHLRLLVIGQLGLALDCGRLLFVCLGVLIASSLVADASAAPPAPAMMAAGVVGQGAYGTIKGRLVWGGSDVPPPAVEIAVGKAAKDPDVCAKDKPIPWRELLVDPRTKGVANGFVYIVRPKGTNPEAQKELLEKKPRVELDQINCEYMPYVLALHQDQTLVIKSSDSKGHNVRFSAFNNGGFNQILAANGQLEKKLVSERFPIVLACDIHPWMKGYMMVFDHPFYTITGPDGAFELKGVPAGTQNLVVRQETAGWVTPGAGKGMPVVVKAGDVTDVGEIVLDPSKCKLNVPSAK